MPDVTGARRESAQAILLRAGLELGDVRFDADARGSWGVVIRQDPSPTEETVAGGAVDIVIAGPDLVRLPYLVRIDEQTARRALGAASLRLGRLTRVHDDHVDEGVVISQEPRDELFAPRGSAIDLTVSLGPSTARVPGVYGMWREDAREFVHSVGLDTDISEEYDRYAQGLVVGQDPPPGQRLEFGQDVEILVSKGLPPIQIPDVRLLSLSAARSLLRSEGLTVIVRGEARDAPVVVRQDPMPGSRATEGSGVTIWIAAE